MTACWGSQLFPPDGASASDGILKQLGAPTLDPLVVLVRETAQNSWDARLEEQGVIDLEYSVEGLRADWARSYRKLLLPGPAGDMESFDGYLDENAVVLCVSDRNTSGLGGPLHSDIDPEGVPPDFVNFVRNAGEPRDKDFGGGTYGFGKGALYRVSRPGVILVDTLCRVDGGEQRRLIGAALGHAFTRGGKRYTGRHWWGIDRGGVVDPLLDDDARAMADRLGLRGFEDGVTGTDVYVIAADLGESAADEPRSLRQAGEVLASAGLWYLWPRLLLDRDRGGINLSVYADGEPLRIPNPRNIARLRCFIEALEELDAGGGSAKTRRSAPHTVGHFAAKKDLWLQQFDPVVDAAAPFEGRSRHCARMRHVELIVDYVPGDDLGDPDRHYGAVFRAADEKVVDDAFSAAEPPTHDAWNIQHLVKIQKGIVRDAGAFVKGKLAEIADSGGIQAGGGADVPLAALANSLAAVLPGAGGDRADDRRRSRNGGGSGPSSRVRAIGQPRLVLRDGEAVVSQAVVFAASSDPLTAETGADVAVDGGTERDAPSGAAQPIVLGWANESGDWISGSELTVNADGPRNWTVYVRPAPDTSTRVRVKEVKS